MSRASVMADMITGAVEQAMRTLGEDIAADARANLMAAGHIDTGALYNSIRAETVRDGDTVTTYIIADAESEDGAKYAEFIELGTGAAHGRAGGRVGTWRYKDRNGNWHTTDGMDADPFLEPALEQNITHIRDYISDVFEDIAKYGR